MFRIFASSEFTVCDDVILRLDIFTALALNYEVKITTVRGDARIMLGNHVGMSAGCIDSAGEISTGSELLPGADLLFVDTGFHPICPFNRRHSDKINVIRLDPANIGNNVLVRIGRIILKAVTIVDEAAAVACSVVVSGEYQQGAILAGTPARVVGTVHSK